MTAYNCESDVSRVFSLSLKYDVVFVQISIFLPWRSSTGIVKINSSMYIIVVPPVHRIACLICVDVTTSNAQDRHHLVRLKSCTYELCRV